MYIREMLFMQSNLGRDKLAMDLLEHTIMRRGVDIVIVAEPNKKYVERQGWWGDKNKDVAIRVWDPKLIVQRSGGGEGYVWIQVQDMNIYGCYFSPNKCNEDFETFLGELTNDMRRERRNELIVMGDFNAKSPVSNSKKTDRWTGRSSNR